MPRMSEGYLLSDTEEQTLYSVITMLRTSQEITKTQRIEILEKFMRIRAYLYDKYGVPKILQHSDILLNKEVKSD
jgi:hypothetical protein